MHTFLLIASSEEEDLKLTLHRTSQAIMELLPRIEPGLSVNHELLDEINIGYFIISPNIPSQRKLISTFHHKYSAVLVFGEVFDNRDTSHAKFIHDTWQTQGVDSVRLLNGSFSAVLIDISQKRLHIISDILGMRTLRFSCNNGKIFISPHDINIVTSSFSSVSYDPVSIASILLCEWSLQGRSIIKGIDACDPNAHYIWANGSISSTFRPLLITDSRIDVNNDFAIKRQFDLIIDDMRKITREYISKATHSYVDLTAGFDSRATLAIIFSIMDKTMITALTGGETNSVDYLVANKIAIKLGLAHNLHFQDSPTIDDFVNHCKIRAYLLNGDSSAKRSTGEYPNYTHYDIPCVHGGGGEIHRGFYYPRKLLASRSNDLNDELMVEILKEKIISRSYISIINDSLVAGVKERLHECYAAYSIISNNAFDMMDLMYIYERYGKWGSAPAKLNWKMWYSPFTIPSTLCSAFKLPPPISRNCTLHKKIIKTLLPQAYLYKINEKNIAPFVANHAPALILDIISRRMISALKYFRSASRGRNLDQLRADMIRDYCRNHFLLSWQVSTSSWLYSVTNKHDLRRIGNEFLSGSEKYLDFVGNIIIIDQFMRVVEDVLGIVRHKEKNV